MKAAPRWELKLAKLAKDISEAASAYEARWTLAALHRVDPEIHDRLRKQTERWLQASRQGDERDIVREGDALVRGYRKATEVMIASPGVEDDAYWVGRDEASGLVLAVGHQAASAGRVAAIYPEAVFCTVDELAGVLAHLDGFKALAEIKRAFPGSTVLPQKVEKRKEGVQ